MRLLLENGADVNMQGGHHGSALGTASSKGHEIVRLLPEKGADVNMQGGVCGSALGEASSKGHEEIVQLLLEKGAKVNMQGGRYGGPLGEAASNGHQAIVRILLGKAQMSICKAIYFWAAYYTAVTGGSVSQLDHTIDAFHSTWPP